MIPFVQKILYRSSKQTPITASRSSMRMSSPIAEFDQRLHDPFFQNALIPPMGSLPIGENSFGEQETPSTRLNGSTQHSSAPATARRTLGDDISVLQASLIQGRETALQFSENIARSTIHDDATQPRPVHPKEASLKNPEFTLAPKKLPKDTLASQISEPSLHNVPINSDRISTTPTKPGMPDPTAFSDKALLNNDEIQTPITSSLKPKNVRLAGSNKADVKRSRNAPTMDATVKKNPPRRNQPHLPSSKKPTVSGTPRFVRVPQSAHLPAAKTIAPAQSKTTSYTNVNTAQIKLEHNIRRLEEKIEALSSQIKVPQNQSQNKLPVTAHGISRIGSLSQRSTSAVIGMKWRA